MNVLEKRKEWVDGLLDGRGSGKERKSEKGAVRLKIMVPIPEYVGADGKKYGPFEPGSKAEMPDAEARLLVKRKTAEALD